MNKIIFIIVLSFLFCNNYDNKEVYDDQQIILLMGAFEIGWFEGNHVDILKSSWSKDSLKYLELVKRVYCK
jgi:hypothetical protein